jgi:HEAT repeat protein
LAGQYPNVRAAAAVALGQLGDRRAIEPLLVSLADQYPNVRAAATEALGQLGDAAVAPLSEALRDDDWQVRRAAAQALGQVSDAAIDPLREALHDYNSRVRQAAAQALRQLGDARAVNLLVRRAQRLPWSWTLPPLALLHGLSDWPLLLVSLAAQVAVLAPPLAVTLPPPFPWLFGLTAWWQTLLLVLLFVVGSGGSWIARVTILFDAQEDRSSWLDTAEQVLRQ